MNTIPSYLQRLGVDETCDERAVKRAYARELKQLDQERDIEGFQQLREAYDASLAWVRRRCATPQAPPQSRYGPPQVPVVQRLPLAAVPDPVPVVLQRFDAAFADLCGGGTPALDSVVALLRGSLADEALESLAARDRFERDIVARLAEGWRPGHETLFPAACSVFGWSGDPGRLRRFGDAGQLLDQAIAQRALFDTQDKVAIRTQRLLIARLREPELPGKVDMMHAFGSFERLWFYLPAWMCVVAPRDNVLRWREYYIAQGKEPGSSFAGRGAKGDKQTDRTWLWGLLLVPVLIKACAGLLPQAADRPAGERAPYTAPASRAGEERKQQGRDRSAADRGGETVPVLDVDVELPLEGAGNPALHGSAPFPPARRSPFDCAPLTRRSPGPDGSMDDAAGRAC